MAIEFKQVQAGGYNYFEATLPSGQEASIFEWRKDEFEAELFMGWSNRKRYAKTFKTLAAAEKWLNREIAKRIGTFYAE